MPIILNRYNMLPDDFMSLNDFENSTYHSITINTTDFSNEDPIISLSMVSYKSVQAQQWTVTIKGHKISKVYYSKIDDVMWPSDKPLIQLLDNHPLLLKYKDQFGSLYFSGHCADPNKLFADLYKAHFAFCNSY